MTDVIAWFKVFIMGALLKLPAKLLAPIAYPFIDKKNHGIWGVSDATDFSFYNIAIRNGAHNMFKKPRVDYTTKGNTDDETLERLEGFQWRFRRSLDGEYVSFRMTWGKPSNKGKKEFYVGWTMSELPSMRLTFFQLRPF